MGWDSWDTFGCGVNERDIEQVANWMVASGMRDAGYRYVIIDDCWYNPTRSASGSLRPDISKFPTGMRWLGWFLHSRGLLFGIYESPSQSTCAQLNGLVPGSTGSFGHEVQDAKTFASWGVDYLKYDWCSSQGSIWDQFAAFEKMRNALRASGRQIVYSINPNSFHSTTGADSSWSTIANLVRTGPDLAPAWDMGPLQNWYSGVANVIAGDARLWKRAGPGHWNDPDALVVGMHPATYAQAVDSPSLGALLNSPPSGVDPSLTFDEMRTNFAMWTIMAAPLMVGEDPRFVGRVARSILLNRRLIAIDQDPLGRQGHQVHRDGEGQIWIKPLVGGAVAAALFNPSDAALTLQTNARQLGLPAASKYTVQDLWSGADSTTKGALSATVPPRGTAIFRLAPVVTPTHHGGQGTKNGSTQPVKH
jgi:alpha-galactosidase